MLCLYRTIPGKEAEFLGYLKHHWPMLHAAGLASDTPARFWKARTKTGPYCFVETFEWKDASSPGVAHQTPELMRVWEPMGALCSDMEFLHLEPAE